MNGRRPPPSPGIALAAALLVAFGALAAGCGQKGPLYLPKKTKTVITPPAPAEPAPEPEAAAKGSPAPAPATPAGTAP